MDHFGKCKICLFTFLLVVFMKLKYNDVKVVKVGTLPQFSISLRYKLDSLYEFEPDDISLLGVITSVSYVGK